MHRSGAIAFKRHCGSDPDAVVRFDRVGERGLARRRRREKEVRVVAPALAARRDPVREERERAGVGVPFVCTQEIGEGERAIAHRRTLLRHRDRRESRGVDRRAATRTRQQNAGLFEELAQRGHE